MNGRVVALAGGVGGAKLALGLSRMLPPDLLTIVVNTGDDEVFHGLHVSPDLDTMMYALAGLTNQETGWGVAGDTFNGLQMLTNYGGPGWFNLGDKDLATHIRRTELLNKGWTLTEVTRELTARLGVAHNIVPMTDGRVRTIIETDDGDLPFQTYFVQHGCRPVARGIRYDGAEGALPSPRFLEALESAHHLVVCPSNPFLSIGPVLALPGVRERISGMGGCRLAVSPIVGGEALRGPAAKLLGELGHQVSCVSVARYYLGLCETFVLDQIDQHLLPEIEALGMKAVAAPTIMTDDADKERLARQVCALLGVPANRAQRAL